ncbi:MAG: hypothetical protein ACTSR2_04545 [Candidatus Hodarchaeales archaeon]
MVLLGLEVSFVSTSIFLILSLNTSVSTLVEEYCTHYSLRIFYNPKICDYSRILSSLHTIVGLTPTKVYITRPKSDNFDRTIVYSLNPSSYSGIVNINRINVQCPINLHDDCYKIIHQIFILDRPVTISELSKKLRKGTRVVWDRIHDILPLGLIIKIESEDGLTNYGLNPAHYLVNANKSVMS